MVRSFVASPDEEKKMEARRKEQEEQGGGGGGRGGAGLPGRKEGGNRYTWDLRYPGATMFDGPDHVGRAIRTRDRSRCPAITRSA